MASPEQEPVDSLFPPLPDANEFETPFFALVAQNLWENQRFTDIQGAVELTVTNLNPSETFALAKYIDTLSDGRDESDKPAPSIWQSEFRDLTVDACGLIIAVVGDTQAVKRRILGRDPFEVYYEDDVNMDVLCKLTTHFEYALFRAAAKKGGDERAALFMDKLHEALQEREQRKAEAKDPRRQPHPQEPLFRI